MIHDVSELLKGIMHEERSKLDEYSLKHGPTIGKMYEGLASDVLGRAIPESLGLQLQHGIIHDGKGAMSGEIDCMLVKGEGEKIPYTDSYKWHVKDVIAVIEVKKTLYSADLKDAFGHLRGVADNYGSYVQSGEGSEKFDINPAKKAFSETTGLIPPDHSKVDSLGIEMEMLYHTFVMEHISPIRIVLGYHGFKKESSLREALVSFINENQMTQGFGVGSFPQIIVCGNYSLIKMNGYPYSAPMDSDFWNFYASSNANPILLILELIWTRLSYQIKVENLWGEDLSIENFTLFLSAKIKKVGDLTGWEYKYTPISEDLLKERAPEDEWSPTIVSSTQFVIFNRLCNEAEESIGDKSLREYVEKEGENFDHFIESLTSTGLIALKDDKLQLTTYECQCVILPDGRFAVADNNSGRLTRWVNKQIEKNKA